MNTFLTTNLLSEVYNKVSSRVVDVWGYGTGPHSLSNHCSNYVMLCANLFQNFFSRP